MARQIRVELSCNVLSSISAQLSSTANFSSAPGEAEYYLFTLSIANSALLRFVTLSEAASSVKLTSTNFSANCYSALTGYLAAAGELFTKSSSDKVWLLSLVKYSPSVAKLLAFTPNISSANKIQVIGAMDVINTAFSSKQPTFGFYVGFANANQLKTLVPISQSDYAQADKVLLGLIPANASNFVVLSFSPQGQANRKIKSSVTPNAYASNFFSFDSMQTFSEVSDSSSVLGAIADSQVPERVQLILLNGPGKIDDSGIWVITKNEFEEYAKKTGYAFAKILLKPTNANPSVQRLILLRPGANPLESAKEFFRTYSKEEQKTRKLVWSGPNIFETKVNGLFQLDITTYLKNAGTIDTIVSEGPGYVLNNVFHFVPTQPGLFNVKLDILDLSTGEQLIVELIIGAVSSEIHDKITFNIYGLPNELVKIPLELVIPNVEQSSIKVLEIKEKAWLASNIVHIYNQPGAYMKLLVQSGAKNYLEIEFVSGLAD